MNKIKLVKHFDELISRLDLVVETALTNNRHDENLIARFKKHRDAFINEIRYIEAHNLRSLSDLKPQEDTEPIDLFAKFCFFIGFHERKNKKATFDYDKLVEQEIGLRLIVTDKYLTEGQIKCFEALFNRIHEQEVNRLDFSVLFDEKKNYVASFFLSKFNY
jgi:hypothetical protein